MTLRHLRIFQAVCDNGCNMTKAAEALHMTQPAASLAIKELEGYYGVVLFDRLGRRLRLSGAGERLLGYARHITSSFDEMEEALGSWERPGVLRVGASMTIGSQFLPGYVKAITSRLPGAEIRATVGPTELLESRLLENTLDLALVEGVPRSELLVTEEYMEDSLAVICPRDSGYESGQELTQEEFRRQKFLLREPGSGAREEFERVTAGAGFAVSPSWEAMSTTALVNAVISGLGISVLPARMIRGAAERGLVTVVRVNGLDFTRWFRIAYHRDKYLTPLAAEFMALVRSYELDYPDPQYTGLY